MQYLATIGQHLCLGKINGAGAAARIEQKLQLLEQVINQLGTTHLRRQHVLGGEGCPHGPMVQRSQCSNVSATPIGQTGLKMG